MSPAVAATAIATVASDPAYFCSAYILEVEICVTLAAFINSAFVYFSAYNLLIRTTVRDANADVMIIILTGAREVIFILLLWVSRGGGEGGIFPRIWGIFF